MLKKSYKYGKYGMLEQLLTCSVYDQKPKMENGNVTTSVFCPQVGWKGCHGSAPCLPSSHRQCSRLLSLR